MSNIGRDSSFFSEIQTPAPATSSPTPAPVAPAPQVVTPAPTPEQRALATGSARAKENNALALALGFPPKRLLYAVGHPVAEVGKDTWRQMRKDHESTPFFSEVCGQVIAEVEGEHREDHIVPIDRLSMDETGALLVAGRTVPIEEDAFGTLVTRVGMYRAGSYLATVDPDLRALNVNRHLQKIEAVRLAGHTEQDKSGRIVQVVDNPAEVMLRTRNGNGPRKVFAVVGKNYQALDVDEVAEHLRDVIPADARGTATYDGQRARFTALWLADIDADELVVGDMLRAGVQVRTDDTGRGSLVMQAVLEQARCVNLTKVTRTIDVLRQVHSAKGVDLRQLLREATDKAISKITPFVNVWRKAAIARVVDEDLHHADVEPVFARLVQQRLIQGQTGIGVTDEELVRRLRAAYWKQPSPTVKGITDAITRTAHETAWSSPWTVDTLEENAGTLIRQYAKVVDLGRKAIEEATGKGWKPGQFTADEHLDSVPVLTFKRTNELAALEAMQD